MHGTDGQMDGWEPMLISEWLQNDVHPTSDESHRMCVDSLAAY